MDYSRQDKVLKNTDFHSEISSEHLLLIGCGGVGSVLAELLVRGGFKRLTLLDNDLVDTSNLQRQLYREKDIGIAKVKVLKQRLLSIDPSCSIEIHLDLLNEKTIEKYTKEKTLLLDCSDTLNTRKLLHTHCSSQKIPWLYTGAIGTRVACHFFLPSSSAFPLLFPKNSTEEQACESGVLASTTFIAASLGYNELLKYYTGKTSFTFIQGDMWEGTLRSLIPKGN